LDKAALAEAKQNEKAHGAKKNTAVKWVVIALALLLVMSLTLAAWEYNEALFFKSEINQRDSTMVDRDTLITQLYTALNLAQLSLNLKLPIGSQYLTTLPAFDHEANPTKIFLVSTAVGYSYLPPYPFKTPWFNGTSGGSFSSQRVFELTDNRSIPLSFWGWNWFGDGNYEFEVRSGEPFLMIGVTVRNDYVPADAENGADPNVPIGNSTDKYASIINLAARLYSQNGSIIHTADANDIQSPTARGGQKFALASGETTQVVFYLSPSSLDIDHYEIYVSYLSSNWQP
jgi:hypothetical protein